MHAAFIGVLSASGLVMCDIVKHVMVLLIGAICDRCVLQGVALHMRCMSTVRF